MKTMLFHILRTFRWLIVPLFKFASGFFALFSVIFLFNDTAVSSIISGVILAVVLGAVAWYYDVLLKKLEPRETSNQEWS